MSEPFIAEIKIFAGNFAPRGYAFCDGTLLPISQNTALFSLIGTIYGGDGRTTTALPDLRGRAPMHKGTGAGLTPRQIGQRGGSETETLNTGKIPVHTHSASVTLQSGNEDDPSPNKFLAAGPTPATLIYGDSAAVLNDTMVGAALPDAGGSQSHTNQQPYLRMSFIIALSGVYPSRS